MRRLEALDKINKIFQSSMGANVELAPETADAILAIVE